MSAAPQGLLVVVGSGGVGKTSLAAALGLRSADRGHDTLVMTFDPSLRLKDALGVSDAAREDEVEVDAGAPGRLFASLLDARRTFDRLLRRYAPDEASRRRIMDNRYYQQLAGHLAGILEYMAVERLFEVAREGRYQRVILDTPPTRQALDFLAAPERIVSFLDSGALRIALRPWFDERGRLRAARRFGPVGRSVEGFLDRVVGLELLRDMAEFFQAFAPLYGGFRERAVEVRELLAAPETRFLLVTGAGAERIPDTMFFARRLDETGYRLGQIVVNRVHPPELAVEVGGLPDAGDGRALVRWLAARDRQGLEELSGLVGDRRPLVSVPMLEAEPTSLPALRALASHLPPVFDAD